MVTIGSGETQAQSGSTKIEHLLGTCRYNAHAWNDNSVSQSVRYTYPSHSLRLIGFATQVITRVSTQLHIQHILREIGFLRRFPALHHGAQVLTAAVCEGGVEEAEVFGCGLGWIRLLSRAADVDQLGQRQNRCQEVRRRQGPDVHARADLLRQLQGRIRQRIESGFNEVKDSSVEAFLSLKADAAFVLENTCQRYFFSSRHVKGGTAYDVDLQEVLPATSAPSVPGSHLVGCLASDCKVEVASLL